MTDTREQLDAEIAESRRQRGIAMLDGGKVDYQAVAKLEARRDALPDAEAELKRRKHAEAAAEAAQIRERERKVAAELRKERAEETANAQATWQACLTNIARGIEATKKLNRFESRYRAARFNSSANDPADYKRRIQSYMKDDALKLMRGDARFFRPQFGNPTPFASVGDWVDAETRLEYDQCADLFGLRSQTRQTNVNGN